MAPPPQLPARVPAIRPRHGKRKLLESQLSAYVGQRFGVADAGQDMGCRRHPGVQGGLRLGDKAAPNLLAAPIGQAAVDGRQVDRESDADR